MLDKQNQNIQKKIDQALHEFKNANYNEAINILEKLKKEQNHFLIYWYLGHSYFRIYDFITALDYIKKSIELKKSDTLNLSFLGEIYLSINKYKDAINTFKKVLDLDSKNINSLFKLAKANYELGKITEAEKYFNQIIQIQPMNMNAWYELIKINQKYLTNDLIKKVKNNKSIKNFNDVYAKFIIAENHKYNKNFEAELDNLVEAHDCYTNIKYKSTKQEFNYFTNLLPKFISKVKNVELKLECKYRPIFIMGLPRSGTTLIENVISNFNNKIETGGEAGVFSQVFFSKDIISNYDSNKLNSNFDYTKNNFKILKKSIIDQYNQLGINISNNIFTDKSIENFLYIELIEKIFPKAKFIYCKRNNIANLIGILKVFLPNLYWTHSVENIITLIELYNDKLNEIILEKKINLKVINLENFTQNPLESSKDLFNFLQIKNSNEITHNPMNKEKIIKTVSNLQVRKKIQKHDLNYLENYLPLLNKYPIDKLV